jgi:hypothetical protein
MKILVVHSPPLKIKEIIRLFSRLTDYEIDLLLIFFSGLHNIDILARRECDSLMTLLKKHSIPLSSIHEGLFLYDMRVSIYNPDYHEFYTDYNTFKELILPHLDEELARQVCE